MTLDTVSSEARNKYVTVTLTYDEVRDIANGLYECCKHEDTKQYVDIKNKFQFIFDMVKHGMIQSSTIDKMYNHQHSLKDPDGGT